MNIEITNYDLVTPDKATSARDHATEYFEADEEDAVIVKIEDTDVIDIEDDSEEENGSSASHSGGANRRSSRLWLRL